MSTGAEVQQRQRVVIRVRGTVQGVGFRPFLFRLAEELRLGGAVFNDAQGVEVQVEGSPAMVAQFLARLHSEAPPLANVESVQSWESTPQGERRFQILPSQGSAQPDALVSADVATCDRCLQELQDPANRRHRYPFINCTDCGPRFTIVEDVPYDRAATTMHAFEMCAACQREYEDPRDRRFHAQPNACPICGPQVWLRHADGLAFEHGDHQDAIAMAASMLADGQILAIKGIGGYHLACRADREDTVGALRAGKHREHRPFALMVASLDIARSLIEVTQGEAALLQDRARPIVIARGLPRAAVADALAPGCPDLGVMLPYSPLHHILLADLLRLGVKALVMTSGNLSEEPIAYRDLDAFARLAGLATAFLTHDRPIHIRTDDSVIRATTNGPLMMRRSRGYVPASISLPRPVGVPLLAVGAELKSTFCLARGERAWVSHHIGDLKSFETLRSFQEGISHMQRLFSVQPEAIAHDLHPDYLSTRYAEQRIAVRSGERELRAIGVQHHHAHLAAVLAEHGQQGPAVGIVCDGTGHGLDGTVWGGELLVGGLGGFERRGWLRTVGLPGGDMAVREPWRMACAWLAEMHGPQATAPMPSPLESVVPRERWDAVAGLLGSRLTPLTSSVGRLFDAVAAMCGICPVAAYEGQAAIELEGVVDLGERGAYPFELRRQVSHLEIDPRLALHMLIEDHVRGAPIPAIAARFHNGLADALVGAAEMLARRHALDCVVFAGGVFQNRVLLERAVGAALDLGLRPLTPRLLPAGDGAISYGQAAVAAAQIGH